MRMFRSAAVVAAAAVLASCDSPTGSPRPRDILPETDVEGTLAPGGEDVFQLDEGSTEYRLLLRARGGSAADTLVATLEDEAGAVLATVRSAGTDSTLLGQASGWVASGPPGQTVRRVRVRGAGRDDAGAYTLRASSAVRFGETVEAAVGWVGNMDDFPVQGTAGQEVIVFARFGEAPAGTLRVFLVEAASGDTVTGVAAGDARAGAGEVSSGRVRLPRTGTYLVRAAGDRHANGVGPYAFRVDAVAPGPEAGPAAIAYGQVAEEAIARVGDVDEYTFQAAGGDEVNLMVQLVDGLSDGLLVELVSPAGEVVHHVLREPTAALDDWAFGRRTLHAAGTYTVRLSGTAWGAPAETTGPYRLEVHRVDRAPENGGTVHLDGAAVHEALERAGDVDEFTVDAAAGELVVLRVDGPAPARGPIAVRLMDPAGQVLAEAGPTGNGPDHSARAVLPVTGTYHIRVEQLYTGMNATGPYSLSLYSVSAAPESVSAALRVGQTVTGERIDRPGDLDHYVLRGEVGDEVNVFVGGDITAYVGVRPDNQPWSGIFAPTGTASLDGRSTGRLVLRDTLYHVTVDPQTAGSRNASAGSYGLRVFRIDRRPEGRAAAYVPGKTMEGEVLYPAGDIDEYTFTLTDTTTLDMAWEAERSGHFNRATARLWDEATGRVVWWAPDEGTSAPAVVTLPPGDYRLRVLQYYLEEGASYDLLYDLVPTLRYRFTFTPR